MSPILSDSSSDVPGAVFTLKVKVPSLKFGKKLLPKIGIKPIDMATNKKAIERTILGCLRTFWSMGLYEDLRIRTMGVSPFCFNTFNLGRR
jgi:hypothetical protein